MAFGRDTNKLETVGTFRQVGSNFASSRKDRPQRSGGGTIPYFVNQYKPSLHALDTIRLIPGAYSPDEVDGSGNIVPSQQVLPFWPYTEHYDGRTEKSCICSAGPAGLNKNTRLPCYGCDLYWSGFTQGPDGKKKKGRMSKRDMFVFTVLDYAPYHKVPQTDQRGQARTAPDGTPYYNWLKCTGRACKFCASNFEVRQGNRMHWSLGSTHFNTLLEYDALIGASCCTCGQKDCITVVAWLCQNPECGDAVIDMSSTTMDDKEIATMSTKVVRCKTCNTDGYLRPMIECANCTPKGHTPRQATIFDVDLKLKRVESKDEHSNATTLMISSWSDPSPVSAPYAEAAKNLDLAKVFTPTTLENQAKLFDYTPDARQPVTTGYSG